MSDEIEVRDEPDRERYEVRVGGQLAGFAQYVRRGNRTFFVHTEIEPDYENRGLGSRLAAGALAAERAAGARIVPLCPFIRAYIDRHPDELANVDKELIDRIDAG